MGTVKMTKAQSRSLTMKKSTGEQEMTGFRRNLSVKQAELALLSC